MIINAQEPSIIVPKIILTRRYNGNNKIPMNQVIKVPPKLNIIEITEYHIKEFRITKTIIAPINPPLIQGFIL